MGVVFGGDAGGSLLAEAHGVSEGCQVFVAGLSLQLRCCAAGGGQMPQRGVPQLVQRPADAVRIMPRGGLFEKVFGARAVG